LYRKKHDKVADCAAQLDMSSTNTSHFFLSPETVNTQ